MYEIFVINLDRHQGRLTFMETQFKALGLSFKRLPAVNGYDPAAIANTHAASYAPLPNGEIGCFESHRSAWQKIVDDGLEGAYIFEDDMVVSSDFATIRYPEEVLADTDIIKIDIYPRDCHYGTVKIPLSEGRHLQRLLGTENSAGGYFMTKRGAEKMLEASKAYFLPVDLMMFAQDSKIFWDLKIWKVFPCAAGQLRFFQKHDEMPHEIADGIQTKRREKRDPRPSESALRKIQLRLRRVLDWDIKSIRTKRARDKMQAFNASEASELNNVGFETDDRAHIDQALARMSQDDTKTA